MTRSPETPPPDRDHVKDEGLQEQCWNCQFFTYIDQSSGMGLCRRHAPPPMNGTGSSSWPLASNIDWCGEYAPLTKRELLDARKPRT